MTFKNFTKGLPKELIELMIALRTNIGDLFPERNIEDGKDLGATIKRTHLTGTVISMQISLSARILIQLSKLNSAGRKGPEWPRAPVA